MIGLHRIASNRNVVIDAVFRVSFAFRVKLRKNKDEHKKSESAYYYSIQIKYKNM